MVVEAAHANLLAAAVGRAWRGGAAEVVRLALPAGRGKSRELLFAWGDGAPPVRTPRWPEVLIDWHDIHGDPLFPGDALPVLAEELSALGAEALALHAEPGLAGATVAWYERGALALYEHVGSATVSWTEADGLGRPPDGTLRSAAVGFVLDRIALQNRANGEALLERALHRILAHDPPPFDELAGMVVTAPRLSL
ncbi:MAG TPA: hypothetical protein VFU21_00770 [Kofleriaceae bacterium]|nr:hypothetical protein [Kofleriaceae bacterium]